MKKTAVIECGKESELYVELRTKLAETIPGKTVWYGDHLGDLVRRHCPEIYDIADRAGYRFIPSSDKNDLTFKPPQIWFDVVRKSEQLD